MAVVEINEVRKLLSPQQRLLGLDLGTKTIGLALSDVMMMVATPYDILPKEKFSQDLAKLQAIIKEQDVGALVLGLPREMDGSEGKRCQSTRAFASNILQHVDIPIVFWDERLSTVAVERVLVGQADMTRKRRKDVVDKAAAAYILQGVLDALAMRG